MNISQGAPKIPRRVIPIKKSPKRVVTLLIRMATSSLDFLALYSPRIGTNAWVNAPSAEIRLNKFGILNATKKASVTRPAPKTRAIILSLKNPRILDKKVMLPTPNKVLNKFITDQILPCTPW